MLYTVKFLWWFGAALRVTKNLHKRAPCPARPEIRSVLFDVRIQYTIILTTPFDLPSRSDVLLGQKSDSVRALTYLTSLGVEIPKGLIIVRHSWRFRRVSEYGPAKTISCSSLAFQLSPFQSSPTSRLWR